MTFLKIPSVVSIFACSLSVSALISVTGFAEYKRIVECKQTNSETSVFISVDDKDLILHTGTDGTPDAFELFQNDGLSYGSIGSNQIRFQGYNQLQGQRSTSFTIFTNTENGKRIPSKIVVEPYSSLEFFESYVINCAGKTALNMVEMEKVLSN